tara:strand:- start:9021 stop:9281 length:261 start_codon:yes stop_codon:yes gene_type:complete
MGRLRRELPALNTAHLKMIDYLFRPFPGVVQAPFLRSQVHSLPKGEGDGLGQFLAIHLHDRILQEEHNKNKHEGIRGVSQFEISRD